MMKYADRFTASATSQIEAVCSQIGMRPQPKNHRPRKTDSMKKATRPSKARGPPKTSPIMREYSDQFIPNWNSWTMPVATPMAKLIMNTAPKNLVARNHCGLRVIAHMVCMKATSGARPMVRGTKIK